MKRVLALIADTHIFSRYALNPPEFITADNLLKFSIKSDALMYIYETYKWFCGVADEFGADTVLIDGDAVHGQNPKELGTMLVSPNPHEQVKAAVGLFSMLKYGLRGNFNRKVYMWRGSGYHVTIRGYDVESSICSELGGRWMGAKAFMRFPPSNRIFKIEHGGGGALQYPETKLGKNILYTHNADAVLKRPKVDCIVTAHHHDFISLHKHKIHAIQLPGFMAAEPSPIFQGLIERPNCIGGVIIKIDDDDRIIPLHFTKDPPEIIEKVVDG